MSNKKITGSTTASILPPSDLASFVSMAQQTDQDAEIPRYDWRVPPQQASRPLPTSGSPQPPHPSALAVQTIVPTSTSISLPGWRRESWNSPVIRTLRLTDAHEFLIDESVHAEAGYSAELLQAAHALLRNYAEGAFDLSTRSDATVEGPATLERCACAYLLDQICHLRVALRRARTSSSKFVQQLDATFQFARGLANSRHASLFVGAPHDFVLTSVLHCDVEMLDLLAPPGSLMQGMLTTFEKNHHVSPKGELWPLDCLLTPVWGAACVADKIGFIERLGRDLRAFMQHRSPVERVGFLGPIVNGFKHSKQARLFEAFMRAASGPGEWSFHKGQALAYSVAHCWTDGVEKLLRLYGVNVPLPSALLPLEHARSVSLPLLSLLVQPDLFDEAEAVAIAEMLIGRGANPHELKALGLDDQSVSGMGGVVSAHTRACLHGYKALASVLSAAEKDFSMANDNAAALTAALADLQRAENLLRERKAKSAAGGVDEVRRRLLKLHAVGGHGFSHPAGQRLLSNLLLLGVAEASALVNGTCNFGAADIRKIRESNRKDIDSELIAEEIQSLSNVISASLRRSQAPHVLSSAAKKTKRGSDALVSTANDLDWQEALVASAARDEMSGLQLLFFLSPLAFLAWKGHAQAVELYFATTSRRNLAELAIAWLVVLPRFAGEKPRQKNRSTSVSQQDQAAVARKLIERAQTDQELYLLAETAALLRSHWGIEQLVQDLRARGKRHKLQAPASQLSTLLGLVVQMPSPSLQVLLPVIARGPALREALGVRDAFGDTVLHVAARHQPQLVEPLEALLLDKRPLREVRNMSGRTFLEEAEVGSANQLALSADELGSQFVHSVTGSKPSKAKKTSVPQVEAWQDKLRQATAVSEREAILDAFLADEDVIAEDLRQRSRRAWGMLNVMQQVDPMFGLGVHFQAHRPSIGRAGLVARLHDLKIARECASAFGSTDGAPLLKLRQMALGMARQKIATDDLLWHAVELRHAELAGRGVQLDSTGELRDLEHLQVVRFVLKRRVEDGQIGIVTCYPVTREAGAGHRVGVLRRQILDKAIGANF